MRAPYSYSMNEQCERGMQMEMKIVEKLGVKMNETEMLGVLCAMVCTKQMAKANTLRAYLKPSLTFYMYITFQWRDNHILNI